MTDLKRGPDMDFRFIGNFPGLQERTSQGMLKVLQSLKAGGSLARAAETAGVTKRTIENWRSTYELYDTQVRTLVDANEYAREQGRESASLFRKSALGLVVDPDAERPEVPGLEQFRWDAFGRPSQPHHQDAINEWENKTNHTVMYFCPTGAGKDTTASDAIVHLKCADFTRENRTAYITESEKEGKKKLQRIVNYLTDERTYLYQPAETPGGQIPTINPIALWGPFKWVKGMIYPDGTKIPQLQWTQTQCYFVGGSTNEADPDLWATGVDGSIYGQRIRTAVLSDMFTRENQLSPDLRAKQLGMVRGTLKSRLDGRGRKFLLGTLLDVENNYEALMEEWVPEGTGVLYSDEFVTRYRNGVAIVRHPAILDQGSEHERSFWEERFPFRSQIIVRTPEDVLETHHVHELNDAELIDLAPMAEERIEGQLELRGEPGTDQYISYQATHQQIRVPSFDVADFTDEVLDLCDDPTRSYGVRMPGEVVVTGSDPARKFGAAYVAWGVDRELNTATVIDVEIVAKLGSDGIKKVLIEQPITRWNPIWFCYEVNRHEGELDDVLMQALIRRMNVNVYRHKTHWQNRSSDTLGPAQMVGDMRGMIIKFPTRTPEDRKITKALKAHFKAWDRQSDNRKKPGSPGHEADDGCLAAWVGYIKVREIFGHGVRARGPGRPHIAVPVSIQRAYDAAKARHNTNQRVKESRREPLSMAELQVKLLEQAGQPQ